MGLRSPARVVLLHFASRDGLWEPITPDELDSMMPNACSIELPRYPALKLGAAPATRAPASSPTLL